MDGLNKVFKKTYKVSKLFIISQSILCNLSLKIVEITVTASEFSSLPQINILPSWTGGVGNLQRGKTLTLKSSRYKTCGFFYLSWCLNFTAPIGLSPSLKLGIRSWKLSSTVCILLFGITTLSRTTMKNWFKMI